MIAKIEQLLKEVEALHASNAEELEALRIKYLSKKGAINDLMADFRNVPAEQKKEVGMRLNELKTKAQDKINALKEQFENQDNGCDGLDLTRSAYPVKLGTRHPLTIVLKASTCLANSCIRLAVTCIRQGQPIELSESSTPKLSSITVQTEAVRRQTGLVTPPEQASSAPKICPS